MLCFQTPAPCIFSSFCSSGLSGLGSFSGPSECTPAELPILPLVGVQNLPNLVPNHQQSSKPRKEIDRPEGAPCQASQMEPSGHPHLPFHTPSAQQHRSTRTSLLGAVRLVAFSLPPSWATETQLQTVPSENKKPPASVWLSLCIIFKNQVLTVSPFLTIHFFFFPFSRWSVEEYGTEDLGVSYALDVSGSFSTIPFRLEALVRTLLGWGLVTPRTFPGSHVICVCPNTGELKIDQLVKVATASSVFLFLFFFWI